MTEPVTLLTRTEFPRSAKYDPHWMMEHQMGPNAVWLTEWLAGVMVLEPGMRVLDLGCGKAMSSIFLAKEYGVGVWAADLWISPDHNWRRVCEAGVDDLVCPVKAEAHSLPFAQGFFDAIVAIDSYHYFGTDQLYLAYVTGLLRTGGQIGIVTPGLVQAIEGEVPSHLMRPQANGKRFWEDEFRGFHTAEWWADLWTKSGKLNGVSADLLPGGWRAWADFERACELAGKNHFPSDAEALERDGGRYMGFVRAVGSKVPTDAMNYYDPALGAVVGVDR
jgi:SAM-dependent methyltransferase